ncbi:hypothetical protein SAMN05421748_11766, partial [Paractinoplanes atraurantiacus]
VLPVPTRKRPGSEVTVLPMPTRKRPRTMLVVAERRPPRLSRRDRPGRNRTGAEAARPLRPLAATRRDPTRALTRALNHTGVARHGPGPAGNSRRTHTATPRHHRRGDTGRRPHGPGARLPTLPRTVRTRSAGSLTALRPGRTASGPPTRPAGAALDRPGALLVIRTGVPGIARTTEAGPTGPISARTAEAGPTGPISARTSEAGPTGPTSARTTEAGATRRRGPRRSGRAEATCLIGICTAMRTAAVVAGIGGTVPAGATARALTVRSAMPSARVFFPGTAVSRTGHRTTRTGRAEITGPAVGTAPTEPGRRNSRHRTARTTEPRRGNTRDRATRATEPRPRNTRDWTTRTTESRPGSTRDRTARTIETRPGSTRDRTARAIETGRGHAGHRMARPAGRRPVGAETITPTDGRRRRRPRRRRHRARGRNLGSVTGERSSRRPRGDRPRRHPIDAVGPRAGFDATPPRRSPVRLLRPTTPGPAHRSGSAPGRHTRTRHALPRPRLSRNTVTRLPLTRLPLTRAALTLAALTRHRTPGPCLSGNRTPRASTARRPLGNPLSGRTAPGCALTGRTASGCALTGRRLPRDALTGTKPPGRALTRSRLARNALTGTELPRCSLARSRLARNALTGTELPRCTLAGSRTAWSLAGRDRTGWHLARRKLTGRDPPGWELARNLPALRPARRTGTARLTWPGRRLAPGRAGCTGSSGNRIAWDRTARCPAGEAGATRLTTCGSTGDRAARPGARTAGTTGRGTSGRRDAAGTSGRRRDAAGTSGRRRDAAGAVGHRGGAARALRPGGVRDGTSGGFARTRSTSPGKPARIRVAATGNCGGAASAGGRVARAGWAAVGGGVVVGVVEAGEGDVVGLVVGAGGETSGFAVSGFSGEGAGADRGALLLGRTQVVEPAGLFLLHDHGLGRLLAASSEPAALAPAGLLVAQVSVVGPFGTARCHGRSSPAAAPLSSPRPSMAFDPGSAFAPGSEKVPGPPVSRLPSASLPSAVG